jgi:hypothetical protein
LVAPLAAGGYDRIMTLASDPRAGSSPAVLGPEDDPGAPYTLQRRFYIRVLPGIVLFVAGLVATTIFAARTVTEQIYLRLANERAAGVAGGSGRLSLPPGSVCFPAPCSPRRTARRWWPPSPRSSASSISST